MENGWRYFCARRRERRKERKGKRGGWGRESLCLFPRSHLASIFYPLLPLRVSCFIGERSRELFPFCYRYLPPPFLLPLGPDEINDGINDTALNIGDQPVSQLASMGKRIDSSTPATFRPK